VCLVTGFLGSGKTTLLQRVADRYADRRLAFIVNDFSSRNVDAELLADAKGDVVSVAGGSIFCHCLVTEFVDVMRRVAEGPTLDGVVIEASGIANPRVIGSMMKETGLDAFFRLARVLTVADPATLCKLLRTLPNIEEQIAVADRVLLNKCERHDEQVLRDAEAAIREIHPGVDVQRTSYCAGNVDLFGGPAPAVLPGGDYAKCRDPRFATETVHFGPDIDIERLGRALTAASDLIYRAKGYVSGENGSAFIDFASGQFQTLPADGRHEDGLVLIARGEASDRFAAWLGQLQQEVGAVPPHVGEVR
jgi:G3E family GTPase